MILPVLLMVLFAILQFGVVFNNYIQVTAAAREGARKAASQPHPGDVRCGDRRHRLSQGCRARPKQSSMRITYPNSPTFAQGSDVSVKVTYPYAISIIGVVGLVGQSQLDDHDRVEVAAVVGSRRARGGATVALLLAFACGWGMGSDPFRVRPRSGRGRRTVTPRV